MSVQERQSQVKTVQKQKVVESEEASHSDIQIVVAGADQHGNTAKSIKFEQPDNYDLQHDELNMNDSQYEYDEEEDQTENQSQQNHPPKVIQQPQSQTKPVQPPVIIQKPEPAKPQVTNQIIKQASSHSTGSASQQNQQSPSKTDNQFMTQSATDGRQSIVPMMKQMMQNNNEVLQIRNKMVSHDGKSVSSGTQNQDAPTHVQYLDVAQWINYAFQLDIVLQDIQNYFFFVSVLEISAYFAQILFMVARTQANSIWFDILGLVHPIRALVGFYIYRMLPQTESLIKSVENELPKDQKQLRYQWAITQIPSMFKKTLIDRYQPLEVPLRVHIISTLVCLLVDMLAALVFLIFIGKQSHALVYLAQLLIVSVYFYTDVYLIFYALHLRFRLPKQLQDCVPKAFVGVGMLLKSEFTGTHESADPLPVDKLKSRV